MITAGRAMAPGVAGKLDSRRRGGLTKAGGGGGYLELRKDILTTQSSYETWRYAGYQLDEGDQLGSDYGGPNNKRHDHNGVDIQCNYGDPVYSIESGTVAAVGNDDRTDQYGNPIGSGKYVIINNDDGMSAQYWHLANTLVRVGQRVTAGGVIAKADTTDPSTGNHLHITTEPLAFADTQPTYAERHGGC